MTFRVRVVSDACPEGGGLIADVHGGDGDCSDGAFADRHTNMKELGTGAGTRSFDVIAMSGITPQSALHHDRLRQTHSQNDQLCFRRPSTFGRASGAA
jgi:hypothetical protein